MMKPPCGLLLFGSVACFCVSESFVLHHAPGRHARMAAVREGEGEKKGLSWQESLELLIVPTTPLPQRQILLQVSVSLR